MNVSRRAGIWGLPIGLQNSVGWNLLEERNDRPIKKDRKVTKPEKGKEYHNIYYS